MLQTKLEDLKMILQNEDKQYQKELENSKKKKKNPPIRDHLPFQKNIQRIAMFMTD